MKYFFDAYSNSALISDPHVSTEVGDLGSWVAIHIMRELTGQLLNSYTLMVSEEAFKKSVSHFAIFAPDFKFNPVGDYINGGIHGLYFPIFQMFTHKWSTGQLGNKKCVGFLERSRSRNNVLGIYSETKWIEEDRGDGVIIERKYFIEFNNLRSISRVSKQSLTMANGFLSRGNNGKELMP